MMLIGIDLCSTTRIATMLARSPYLKRELFSDAEIAYCEARPRPERHYSGRWAAKEACLKALGLNILGYELNQIEVVATGAKPALHIGCARLDAALRDALGGAYTVQLSISHEDAASVAVVLAARAGS
jgi:holo-[acyl-carrier protein] synthase